jgi:DNA polymerase-3 subunit gamma/tau
MQLHNELRPTKLSEIVGNIKTVKSLQSILDNDDPPQSYLFHGPRGSGKTSLARIMAMNFNCDITEINTGDNRGIDTAREIIQTLPYRPLIKDQNKAYIIDEVHQTTKDFQNALLKPTEKPPEHVFFFLCTTDPQKLIAPLRSRMQSYQTELLTDSEMGLLIKKVAVKTRKQIPKEVQAKIIDAAEGSPREALVMINGIINLSQEEMLEQNFNSLENSAEIKDLYEALLKKQSWSKVRKLLIALEKENPETIRRAITGKLRWALIGRDKPDMQAQILLEIFEEDTFFDSGKNKLALFCSRAIND